MNYNLQLTVIIVFLGAILGALLAIATKPIPNRITVNYTVIRCAPDGGLMDLCRIPVDCPNHAGSVCND